MVKREKVEELSEREVADLNVARKWVLAHSSEPRATETPVGKAWLVGELLTRGLVQPDEFLKLQSLGVVFGDALAQEMPLLSWKMVTDQFGRNPALVYHGTSLKLLPVTMISKRIERGEQFDAVELFAATCAHIRQVLQRPDLGRRTALPLGRFGAWILNRIKGRRAPHDKASSSGATDQGQ